MFIERYVLLEESVLSKSEASTRLRDLCYGARLRGMRDLCISPFFSFRKIDLDLRCANPFLATLDGARRRGQIRAVADLIARPSWVESTERARRPHLVDDSEFLCVGYAFDVDLSCEPDQNETGDPVCERERRELQIFIRF